MKKITQEEFNTALLDLLYEETLITIVQIPGVYELLSEEYNNDAIERALENKKEKRRKHLLCVVRTMRKINLFIIRELFKEHIGTVSMRTLRHYHDALTALYKKFGYDTLNKMIETKLREASEKFIV